MKHTPKRIVSTFSFPILLLSSSLSLFLPQSSLIHGDDCTSPSTCTKTPHLFSQIKPPFRTPDQPMSCGLPGFDLLCDYSNLTALLPLPSGQTFAVESFDYSDHRITVSDPHGCLPQKLLSFNSSGTPFGYDSVTGFSLYNCSLASALPYGYADEKIACLSGPTYSVITSSYEGSSALLSYGCKLIMVVEVPGVWDYAYSFSRATKLDLNWELPAACRRCVLKGGECERHHQDFDRTTCVNSNEAKGIGKILLSSAVSLLLFILILGVICTCCARMQSNRNQTILVSTIVDHIQARTTEQAINTTGLEQATLDTYPVVTIGDSGRILTQMEEKICSICLSDYQPNEILKTLPECFHCFHADCIDKWLRAKALCPVCRNPPPRTTSRA